MMRGPMLSTVYGIVGVGEIAEAIVTGLCDGVDVAPRVLLSPRTAERSASLAARWATVEVAAGNQEVLDGADVVVLCVRPQDARAILGALRFAEHTPVVSAIARISLDELATLVAPASDLARAIPMPPVARRAGLTAVFPGTPAVHTLFDPLGVCAPVADEDAFTALSTASATVSAHMEYLATIAAWLGAQGIDDQLAGRYIASAFAGLAPALSREPVDLEALAREYATRGGLNERFATSLREGGVYGQVTQALDALGATRF
jgi:pyrroline-5-carboxylate reductase